MLERRVVIANKKGLHARAAAKFVKIVGSFEARVQVKKLGRASEADSDTVIGSSILGLMMLGAEQGAELELQADGPQAAEVIAQLEQLIANKFGEGE